MFVQPQEHGMYSRSAARSAATLQRSAKTPLFPLRSNVNTW